MKLTKAVLEAVAARVLEDSAMVFAMPLTEPAERFYSQPCAAPSCADAQPSSPDQDHPVGANSPLVNESGPGEEEFWGVGDPNTPGAESGAASQARSEATGECFGVQVSFSGYAKGYCELWATRELSKSIASNMLGVFDEDSDTINQTCLDALKETLNILCGNLLTEYAGTEPVFDLDPPAVLSRLVKIPVSDAGAEAWLEIEGQPALLRMCVDPTSIAA